MPKTGRWSGVCGTIALLNTILQAPANAQRPVVAQFDKNGDKRLDGAERRAAREAQAAEPRGFGRRGGFPGGRGGMTPGTPGRKLAAADVRS